MAIQRGLRCCPIPTLRRWSTVSNRQPSPSLHLIDMFRLLPKGCALVLLRRTGEGTTVLKEARIHFAGDGCFYLVSGIDPMLGVCRVLRGDISAGIHMLEELILQEEEKGYRRHRKLDQTLSE